MTDFERLGVFYLGKQYDLEGRKPGEELVLYDSKDLTTHAVCVGMTGSGKTGLCLALLEEAAIDGVPAILVDPKGDLGNLLLAFPRLDPSDFRPWVDEAEAARAGLSADDFAAQTAARWRAGLAAWGQDAARIERYRSAVELTIYTPGSTAGVPLTVLRNFAAPAAADLADDEAMRERVVAAASGLLALLGLDADPTQSREHILLANILDRRWREGRDVDLAELIRAIQTPPFDKVGMVDLETFFPASQRTALAMRLNNLLAAPGFAAWLEGEPLDVERLLYTPAGKPRISILSIAHLSDAERMSFVTILLGEVLAWVRRQPGTSSLRALLYMDEVFGYFPPSANPPSKKPMLTLLKQARAFGLGVVLATQNPVDLDYKGLSNAGTWFLGRLQTERDKLRVLEGLEGASTAAGATFDRGAMEAVLSSLGNRVFLMQNVHDDQPVVFQTRWCLSYLRGPLTRGQIQTLMQERKGATEPAAPASAAPTAAAPKTVAAGDREPLAPPQANVGYLAASTAAGQTVVYRPALLGAAKVHLVDARQSIDEWRDVSLLAHLDETGADDPWTEAEEPEEPPNIQRQPAAGAAFEELPASASQAKSYTRWQKALQTHLHRTYALELWSCPSLSQMSRPGEGQGAFRIRLQQAAREARDAAVEELRRRYATKLATLADRVQRAEERAAREKSQYHQQTFQTVISVGASLLGALVGRKVMSRGNLSSAASAMRSAGRAARERDDIGRVEESVETLRQRYAELEAEFQAEVARIESEHRPEGLLVEPYLVRPKKTAITVDKVSLLWIPQ